MRTILWRDQAPLSVISLVLNFLWLFSLIKSMIGTYVYSVGFVRVENWYLPIIQLCSVVIHFYDRYLRMLSGIGETWPAIPTDYWGM